ncbi:MAG: tRNA-dihydrouridine synthase family protein [Treponemataceae bacterium]|nr:tRNA-dihydrouridine synthase family protein [Treponemataceae bacterium]
MKLLLAPMATLSHEALRRAIYRHGGCDEYYTEMINAASLVNGGKFEKFYILSGPEPEKIVWQLTGENADKLAHAASIVKEKGGLGIDINMGCSAPEIYKHGAGIAWMMKPQTETREMLRKVRSCIGNLRFSAKIRLGDEDFTEESLFSFIDMLIEEGITRIVIHPRTRKEKYSRPPRWNFIKKIVDHIKNSTNNISIIGNGCVSDKNILNALYDEVPEMDGVMIGRAAVQKPWIFSVLSDSYKTNFVIDLYKEAELFTSDLLQYQPKEFYETRSKRFFSFFLDNFMYAHYLRTKILNTSDRETQLLSLQEYFQKMPEERFCTVGGRDVS